jgi:hypothetical protein
MQPRAACARTDAEGLMHAARLPVDNWYVGTREEVGNRHEKQR